MKLRLFFFSKIICMLFVLCGATFFMASCSEEEEMVGNTEQNEIFRSSRATADPGYNVINRVWDSHAQVVMENSIENQGTADEFCQATPEHLVFFRIYYDCGYEFTVEIRGLKTNKTYYYEWIEANDPRNNLGLAAYGFNMPDEEVTITATSAEKTTYAGEAFAGTYHAFQMTVGQNLTTTGNGNEATINLLPSSRFEVSESDGNNYSGEYQMDEERYSFWYATDTVGLHRDMSDKCGLQGFWYGGEDAIGVTVDIEDNRPETHHLYYCSKQAFTYKCVAESSYGKRFLLEIKKSGQQRQWFFFYPETYTFYELTTNELNTSSEGIAGACDVLFYHEGEPFLHYTRQNGKTPTFRYISKEKGTYKCEGLGDLTLDGAGRAQWGDIKGSYTIDGINVDFISTTTAHNGTGYLSDNGSASGSSGSLLSPQTTVSGITRQTFVLDNITMTYKRKQDVVNVKLAENWNGSITESDQAAYWDGSATRATIYIQLEHDFSGKAKEGYAGVHIKIYNKSFFHDDDMISATVPYVYNPDTKQLTLKDVLQGNGGTSSIKKDINFNLVDDKFVGTSKVYVSGSSTRYIDFTKVALTGN